MNAFIHSFIHLYVTLQNTSYKKMYYIPYPYFIQGHSAGRGLCCWACASGVLPASEVCRQVQVEGCRTHYPAWLCVSHAAARQQAGLLCHDHTHTRVHTHTHTHTTLRCSTGFLFHKDNTAHTRGPKHTTRGPKHLHQLQASAPEPA